MATAFICDGCGDPMPDTRKVGKALVRDYCIECEPKAQAFLEAEEGLRNAIVEEFLKSRATLAEVAQLAKLPDVPDA